MQKIKIALFDAKPYDIQSFQKVTAGTDVDVKFFEAHLTADTAELAKGFDGVCAFVNDTLDEKAIDILHHEGVKLIALRCAGYNNVDLTHAFGRIHVVRVPAYSPNAVAEHAMALLLTSIRRIHKAYNRTRDFNFSLSGLTGFELHNKTVGIVGTGRIGRAFIQICQGFGMKVLAHDKFPAPDLISKGVQYVSLAELFQRSDVISLHCPLTDASKHMINQEAIASMKKGVVILNTSRGALVDSEALLEGIKARQVGAACLDVYEEESDIFFNDFSGHIVNDDTLARLITMPNVIVTSHQAFLTEEALESIAKTTLENIQTFFRTGICPNELCYHCGNQDTCRKERKEKCF